MKCLIENTFSKVALISLLIYDTMLYGYMINSSKWVHDFIYFSTDFRRVVFHKNVNAENCERFVDATFIK